MGAREPPERFSVPLLRIRLTVLEWHVVMWHGLVGSVTGMVQVCGGWLAAEAVLHRLGPVLRMGTMPLGSRHCGQAYMPSLLS